MSDSWNRVSAGRDDSWQDVAEAARGTATSPAALTEQFGVDEHQVEDQLAGLDVETCPGCGWWCESSELDSEGYCADCHTGGEP